MTDDTPQEFVRWINAVEGRLYRLETERETFWNRMAYVEAITKSLEEAITNHQSPKKTNGDHKPPQDDDPSPIVA